MGEIEQFCLLAQRHGGSLTFQREERGNGDGEQADETSHKGRTVGRAMLQRVTQHRQRDACRRDQEHTTALEETAAISTTTT